jgi:predicted anti-sigma-YlaC factor YlaD
MNCKELAFLLADYFDGSMDAPLKAELEAHLAMCEPCMKFANTFRKTCEKTTQLRESIEHKIPDEVRARLASFVIDAAAKYPAKMEEYRTQAERERKEKVRSLLRAAVAGKLSSMATLLVETHCAVCPCCKQFLARLSANEGAGVNPPQEIDSHVTRLMESLPPDDEFFLA